MTKFTNRFDQEDYFSSKIRNLLDFDSFIFDLESEFQTLLKDIWDEAYDDGHEDGYDEGYQEGLDECRGTNT